MQGKEILVSEIKDLQDTFKKRRDVACNIPSFLLLILEHLEIGYE